MDITAGLAKLKTQINKLERRIHSLDMDKVSPKELHPLIESLNALKDRYKEMKEEHEKKKQDKESKATEAKSIPMDKDELVKEHEHLVDVLKSPSHVDDLEEAKKQEKELQEYKEADATKFPNLPPRKMPKHHVMEREEIWPEPSSSRMSFPHRPDRKNKWKHKIVDVPAPQEKKSDVAKFAIHDVVEPSRGTPGSKGRVMGHDEANDMVYVAWNEGKLKDSHGYGAYSSKDLKKHASHGRPMGIKDLKNGSFAVVHTDTGAELAMFDSIKEAKDYINKHASKKHAAKEAAKTCDCGATYEYICKHECPKDNPASWHPKSSNNKEVTGARWNHLEVTDKVRCNKCDGIFDEDIIECPTCKTDAYLMQPFMDKKESSNKTAVSEGVMVQIPQGQVELMDETHLRLKPTDMGWTSPLHFQQVRPDIIDALKEAGYVTDDRFFNFRLTDKDISRTDPAAPETIESARGVPGSVFTAETAPAVLEQIKAGVKAPYINGQVSTLGGKENVSILLTIGLDPKESWANGILENSNYAKLQIENDGTIEAFSGSLRMRKANAKTVEDIINKLNMLATPKTASLDKKAISVEFVEDEGKKQDSLESLKQFLNSKFTTQEQMEQQFESLCTEWARNNNFFMKQREDGSILFTENKLGQDFEPRTMTSPVASKKALFLKKTAGGGAGVQFETDDITEGAFIYNMETGKITWRNMPVINSFHFVGYYNGMREIDGRLVKITDVGAGWWQNGQANHKTDLPGMIKMWMEEAPHQWGGVTGDVEFYVHIKDLQAMIGAGFSRNRMKPGDTFDACGEGYLGAEGVGDYEIGMCATIQTQEEFDHFEQDIFDSYPPEKDEEGNEFTDYDMWNDMREDPYRAPRKQKSSREDEVVKEADDEINDHDMDDSGDPDNEPTEDDIFIQNVGHLGAGTAAFQSGDQIAKLDNSLDDPWQDFYSKISDWMDKNGFFPTVWSVSDHGNYHVAESFYEYAKNRQLEREKPELETVSGAHVAWDVILNGKVIETVFYEPTNSAEDVKRGLIEHDGYSPSITVRQRQRASLEIDAKEHKLVIKSLSDAKAECSAGDWHYVRAGSATRKEIEDEFAKHTSQHKKATGEPDQDYDHAAYDQMVAQLAAAGIPGATHKEFDKYQGVYLNIPGVGKLWGVDSFYTGKKTKDTTDSHDFQYQPGTETFHLVMSPENNQEVQLEVRQHGDSIDASELVEYAKSNLKHRAFLGKNAESLREISYEKCTCGHMKFDHETTDGKTKCDECSCTAFSKKASLNKEARVVHQKDGWHVLSEKGKNLGGPYKSKEQAVKRLRQVEYFKHHKGSLNKNATSWNILENGDLEFTLTPDKAKWFDIDPEKLDSDEAMYELLEPATTNGLSFVAPETIGALTDAPILTDGDPEALTNESNIWWFPDYMVTSPARELVETGKVIFKKASKKVAESVSLQDLFKQFVAEGKDEHKAMEDALSMMSMGAFDAVEGERREQYITDALEKMKSLPTEAAKSKVAGFDEWECPKCGDVLETPMEVRIHDKSCDGKVHLVKKADGGTIPLSVFDGGFYAIETSGKPGVPHAFAIFNAQKQQVMVITTQEPISTERLESIVHDEYGKKQLVRATLKEAHETLKLGSKFIVSGIDRVAKEIRLKSGNKYIWVPISKVAVSAENLEQHVNDMKTKMTQTQERLQQSVTTNATVDATAGVFQVGDRVTDPRKGEGTVTYVSHDQITVDWDWIGQKMLGPEPIPLGKAKNIKKLPAQPAGDMTTEAALPPKPSIPLPPGMKYFWDNDTKTWEMMADKTMV